VLTAQEAGEHIADAASEAPIQRLSLQAAFEQLDEEQREAVLLVLVEGLSYKEAAGVLNVPIGTVSSRIARGRESLEALLGGREGGLR
jgi:RNA polymerase sigma-70 factor (ECF subfamily)